MQGTQVSAALQESKAKHTVLEALCLQLAFEWMLENDSEGGGGAYRKVVLSSATLFRTFSNTFRDCARLKVLRQTKFQNKTPHRIEVLH